jgi:hypothetical protein
MRQLEEIEVRFREVGDEDRAETRSRCYDLYYPASIWNDSMITKLE